MKLTKSVTAVIIACMLLTVCTAPMFLQDSMSIDTLALSKVGSTGNEVTSIQKKLKELGFYKGNVDGIYGSGTKNAVIAFQRSVGLTADGVAGKATLLYLGLGSSGSGAGGYSQNEVNLLAKVISAEARGESYTGQVAVGAVVLNRVAHPSFPNTLAGVVYQNGAFSAVKDSNWSASVTDSAKKAALDAINGWDPTGGAIYYYNPKKTNDTWIRSRKVVTTIGSHLFAV